MIHLYIPINWQECKKMIEMSVSKIDDFFFKARRINKELNILLSTTKRLEKELESVKKFSLKYLEPTYPMSLIQCHVWRESFGNSYGEIESIARSIENMFYVINQARAHLSINSLIEAESNLNWGHNFLFKINLRFEHFMRKPL